MDGSPPSTGYSQASTTTARSSSNTAGTSLTFVTGPSTYPSPVSTDGSTLPQQQGQDTGSLTRFAFFFLIVFLAFLFFGLWVVHHNHMGRKARLRVSGQDALARDLNGWVDSRTWVNGAWRMDLTHTRDDEGLDERGEAPPAYQRPEERPPPTRTVNECGDAIGHDCDAPNAGSCSTHHVPGLTMPLPTLSQRGRNLKPPDYHETIRPVSDEASTSPIVEPPPVAYTHQLPVRPSVNL